MIYIYINLAPGNATGNEHTNTTFANAVKVYIATLNFLSSTYFILSVDITTIPK